MPFPSSPVLSHSQPMPTLDLHEVGAGAAFEMDSDSSTGIGAPCPCCQPQPSQPGRPADQHEWTEADLYTLRRDREQAENVRDFYMVSNPGEFPNIFTEDVEEGEERITPSNFFRGRAEADRELYDDSNPQPEVRDSQWYAEVVDMHQSGQYDDAHDARLRSRPLALDNGNDGVEETFEETMARNERQDANFMDCTMTRVNDDMDSDEEEDPRDFINFAEYPHGSLAATLVGQIHDSYEGMSEEQIEAFESDVDDRCVAFLQNDHIPRWQAETIADFVVELRNVGVAREERQNERHAREEARERAAAAEAQLDDAQPMFEELAAEYNRTEAVFRANSPAEFADWLEFRDLACRMGKTPVRRSDILTWYPGLPAEFYECLQDMSAFQRNIAMIRFQVKTLRAQADGEEYVIDPSNEEEWAGAMQQEGQAFGFERAPFRENGFGSFEPPSSDIPIAGQLSAICDASLIRATRVGSAAQRLQHDQAVPSDHTIAAQYLEWLVRVTRYLAELQTRLHGTTAISESDQQAIVRVHAVMSQHEARMRGHVAREAASDADQASGGA